MIRTNLATRPFYNERAVHVWLLGAAILVVAATLFNGWRILHYSGSNTELAAQAARNEARARELRACRSARTWKARVSSQAPAATA